MLNTMKSIKYTHRHTQMCIKDVDTHKYMYRLWIYSWSYSQQFLFAILEVSGKQPELLRVGPAAASSGNTSCSEAALEH